MDREYRITRLMDASCISFTWLIMHSTLSSKAALNHLATTLAVEEPDITTIAFRPGVVATDMQKSARDAGNWIFFRYHMTCQLN